MVLKTENEREERTDTIIARKTLGCSMATIRFSISSTIRMIQLQQLVIIIITVEMDEVGIAGQFEDKLKSSLG